MAAAVDYSKFTNPMLKEQLGESAEEIGEERAQAIRVGQSPQTDAECDYRKLFEAMQKRGLGAACLPSEPRVRVQQQQRTNMMLPATVPYPVNVPRFAGNH